MTIIFQISRHFDIYQSKFEMTPEKLQLIATAKVSAKHKEKWLRWWNMSKLSRQEYNFPPKPASDNHLRVWIDQAAFWAGVSLILIIHLESLSFLMSLSQLMISMKLSILYLSYMTVGG